MYAPATRNDSRAVALWSRVHFADRGRRYAQGLRAFCANLEVSPWLWHTHEHRSAPNLQRARYERHNVYFLAGERGLLVVRVLHESIDHDDHL